MAIYENSLFPPHETGTDIWSPKTAADGIGSVALYGGSAVITNLIESPEVFFRSLIEEPRWPAHALPMPDVAIEPVEPAVMGYEAPVMPIDLAASAQHGLDLAA